MDSRGQGAMEYLMSYGWAILVVLVVGVTMWQLGVLNLSSSTPATSSGFTTIKPALATCKSGGNIWEMGSATFQGFECQFMNVAGQDIVLKDADITVNGRVCSIQVAQDIPDAMPSPGLVGSMFYTVCPNDDPGSCFPTACARNVGMVQTDCAADGTFIPVPKDGMIFAGIYRHVWVVWEDFGFCGPDYSPDAPYEVFFDFTYDVEIGGIVAEKHSSGSVRMVGGPL